MRRELVGTILGLVLALGPVEGRAQDRRLAAIDAYVRKARAQWQAPAIALAIVKDDSVVFARGYGVLERGKPTPADENTLFAIGSASKAFTTASLAMLIDAGKLDWNDRAAERLPGWRLADPWVTREIRIRDLVSHRVGLERADAMWSGTDLSREELLRRQRFIAPTTSFRLAYGYNNHMFLAAGEVIRQVSGQSWDDFVRTRIFDPLGMRRSNTSTKAFGSDPNVATPHAAVGDSVVVIPWLNIDNIGPAGSINSSVREMAEWVRFHLAGGVREGRRLVSEANMAEMHAPQTVIPLEPWLSSASPVNHQMVPGTNFFLYGFGWFLQDYKGRKVVHHGGSIAGMRGLVGMIPSERLGLVVLTNLNPSSIDEAVMFKVFDEYLGGPSRDWSAEMLAGMRRLNADANQRAERQRAARVPGTTPSRPLAEYAGIYADSAYGAATVRVEGERLSLEFGRRTGRLEHWHYDTFQVRWSGPPASTGLVTFTLDSQGRPAALVIPGFPDLTRSRGGLPR
jgi:CubicO group peptidase (beta-lactamase class C family)